MKRALISACLLGVSCRYDGASKPEQGIRELMDRFELVPVCPEQLGGLPTPRPPSECRDRCVFTVNGMDVTEQYEHGARETLHVAKMFNVDLCILKERSPSCGHGEIYDGSFTGHRIPGNGVTADLLIDNGFRVVGESGIPSLLEKEQIK